MRAPGIVGTIRLAGAVVLAIPLVLLGGERLLAGHLDGIAFVCLGALLVIVERFVTNPLDPLDVLESGIEGVTDRIFGGRN